MIMREMSSTGYDCANPERNEQAEKMMRKASRNGFRLPLASDHRAMK
jgi:hypothetical protein